MILEKILFCEQEDYIKTFSFFYSNNFRNVRKNKIEQLRCIKNCYREIHYGFYNLTAEYNDLLFYYGNDWVFDYEESIN